MDAERESDSEKELASFNLSQTTRTGDGESEGASSIGTDQELVDIIRGIETITRMVNEKPEPNLGAIKKQMDMAKGNQHDKDVAVTMNDQVMLNMLALAEVREKEDYLREQGLIRSILGVDNCSTTWKSGGFRNSMTPSSLPVSSPSTSSCGSSQSPLDASGSVKIVGSFECPINIRSVVGEMGSALGKLSTPNGLCIGQGKDGAETIVTADTNNHRIQIFDLSGRVVSCFGVPGREDGFLWHPRKVAVLNCGNYVVCDRGSKRSRMQLFTPEGYFIKCVPLPFIDIVAGIATTRHDNIAVIDSVTPTVFCFTRDGAIIYYFDVKELDEPSDIACWRDQFFISDFKGHRVAIYSCEGAFLRSFSSIGSYPNGIDVADGGEIIVADSHGNQLHLSVYSNDGRPLNEFFCNQTRVSRCCGLRITSDGSLVTCAKSSSSIIILETLYLYAQ